MSEKSRTQPEQVSYLLELYNKEHGIKRSEATEPALVAQWAIAKGHWVRPPPTPEETLRRLITRHLRAEHFVDPQGRTVRAHHAVIYEVQTEDGPKRRSRWFRLFQAPPNHALTAFQLRRRAAVSDVHQLSLDFESYNDNNVHKATLPAMDFDLNKDLEDLKHSTSYPDSPPPDEDDDGEKIR